MISSPKEFELNSWHGCWQVSFATYFSRKLVGYEHLAFSSLPPDYNFPTISFSPSFSYVLSFPFPDDHFLSHFSAISLLPLSHDKAFCQQGPRRMYWAKLEHLYFSTLAFCTHYEFFSLSVQIWDCVLALWLNVRQDMRKLYYLASVNGKLFIHYKRLLLASSKSKAVFGDIVLLLPLLFTEHLVFEIQALKSGIFRKKCQLCCSGSLVL